jgi:hypothetical protein
MHLLPLLLITRKNLLRKAKSKSTERNSTTVGQIDPPMIEIVHRGTPEPQVPLLIFMRDMVASTISVGEELMAFLASRHMQSGWEDAVAIVAFPNEERRHPQSNTTLQ